jgi:hypothetical protein
MAPDAVTSIKNDHRVLEGLFAELQAGKGDRAALVTEVAARLTAHSRAEEDGVLVENLIGSPHFDEALEVRPSDWAAAWSPPSGSAPCSGVSSDAAGPRAAGRGCG